MHNTPLHRRHRLYFLCDAFSYSYLIPSAFRHPLCGMIPHIILSMREVPDAEGYNQIARIRGKFNGIFRDRFARCALPVISRGCLSLTSPTRRKNNPRTPQARLNQRLLNETCSLDARPMIPRRPTKPFYPPAGGFDDHGWSLRRREGGPAQPPSRPAEGCHSSTYQRTNRSIPSVIEVSGT